MRAAIRRYSKDPAQVSQQIVAAAPCLELRARRFELPRAGCAVYGQA